jgi:ligand-binding sensor domain-containing protein/two-component sensor histidine kinase
MKKYHIFFIMFISCIPWSWGRQQHEEIFKLYTSKDGLPQQIIYTSLQDSRGFMWFGTQDGLVRFDGTEFKVFKNNPKNPHSLSSNFVNALIEDQQGRLWIGTEGGGISLFDPKSQQFERLNSLHRFQEEKYLYINALLQNSNGLVWLATNGGLLAYDPQTKNWQQYLRGQKILCLQEGEAVWAGTDQGLWQKNPEQQVFEAAFPEVFGQLKVYSLFAGQPFGFLAGTSSGLKKIHLENKQVQDFHFEGLDFPPMRVDCISGADWNGDGYMNELWVGTYGKLYRFIPESNQHVLSYRQAITTYYEGDDIYSLYQDRQGGIWAGIAGGGLAYFSQYRTKFKSWLPGDGDLQKTDNLVFGFLPEEDSILWLATTGGLVRYNLYQNKIKRYHKEQKEKHGLAANQVRFVHRDKKDRLWVSGWGLGLNLYLPEQDSFKTYMPDPSVAYSLPDADIMKIREAPDGLLWLATNSKGLIKFDPETEKFEPVPIMINGQPLQHSRQAYIDSQYRIWIGSNYGIICYRPEDGSVKHYPYNEQDSTTVSHKRVFCYQEDHKGNLWIATYSGLNYFNVKTGKTTRYYEQEGFPNDYVYDLVLDSQGRVWMTTNYGITCFDPESKKFRNYTREDGLQDNEFNGGALYKDKKGRIYAGGINGFSIFQPEALESNPVRPKVVFTKFELFNQEVKPEENSVLNQHISFQPKVVLDYKQSVLTIHYAALDYVAPNKLRYQYKLEGYDEQWRPVTEQTQTTYTNLDPGTYTFQVKAANSDGLWNSEPSKLTIIVLPPWYLSTGFKITACTGIILLILGLIQLRTFFLRRENNRLEQVVAQQTEELKKKNQELSSSNSLLLHQNEQIKRLVGEMNHRVKNNLQVLGSIFEFQYLQTSDTLTRGVLEEGRGRVQTMLLLHQKLYEVNDSKQIELKNYFEEIAGFLLHTLPPQEQVTHHQQLQEIVIDVEKALPLGLIYNELLTNAIKHGSKRNRETCIETELYINESQQLQLKVRDNGEGLPSSFSEENTSFGFSLIQTFVQQLAGDIQWRNEQGAVFELSIPLVTEVSSEY